MSRTQDDLRMRTEPLYRFFTQRLWIIDREIRENARKIKELSFEQESLKRGRVEMVNLRRELDKQ